MMRRLEYLIIHGNGLTKDALVAATGDAVEKPSPLPDIWASGSKRGFPALKQLVLYPGNEYLCSIPNNDANVLGYRDVNLGEEAARCRAAVASPWPVVCALGAGMHQCPILGYFKS